MQIFYLIRIKSKYLFLIKKLQYYKFFVLKKLKIIYQFNIIFFYFRFKLVVLEELKKFIVFIKNNIEFLKYNVKR